MQKRILIKFCIWLFVGVLLMFYGITHSLALTYTNIGEMKNVTQQLVSTNYGDAPFNNPVNSGYAFSDVLQIDYIISSYNFEANKNYQLESHLSNQRLTNANSYSVTGLNGENCLISYENSIFNDAYPRWAFQCPHATNTITISIRNSSNQYLWSGTGIFNWQTALLKYSDTSLSSSGSDADNIINNNNQNSQNIINNQNKNTEDIINSNKVCETYDFNWNNFPYLDYDKYLNTSGELVDDTGSRVTSYINVSKGDYIYISGNATLAGSYCFYDENKTLLNCNTYLKGTQTVQVTKDGFMRFSVWPSLNLQFKGKYCQNGNQVLNDSINDSDTTDAQNEASDFFSSFSTNTFGLTSIITAPLNLIQSVLSSTCSDLQLPLPFLNNKFLTLPCMTSIYTQHFGTFFTIYQTITYGIIAYWVCVRIFNQVKDFKNPEHDEIEVMDL